jgi:hypothetical protein
VIGDWDGLGWLIGLTVALIFLQRRLHFETQAIFFLITKRTDLALALFSLLFFPGVILHEVSHYLMARLLQVKTGKFSLLPQPLPDGRLRLGYVETSSTDVFRDALIGIAPLVSGGIFVGYAALFPLGLPLYFEGAGDGWLQDFLLSIRTLPDRPDFWIWFYLTFAVSSTMMPSASDRRAWLPVIVLSVLLVGLAALVGAGPWLVQNAAPRLDRAFGAVAAVFGISVGVHLVLVFPLWVFRSLMMKAMGLSFN